jgi:2-hydroxychromene-2-carboxylate isomerase
MVAVDCFFGVLSPWAYLAGDRAERIAAAHGFAHRWRPVDLGRLFAETGGVALPQRHPSRQAYRLQELARWRDRLGVPLTLHPKHWPTAGGPASAAIAAAEAQGLGAGRLAAAVMRAIWAEERDIGDAATLDAVIAAAGIDPAALDRAAGAAAVQAATDEAARRGVFGAPTWAVGEALFWGQDRLDFLDRHLARLAAA